MAASLGLLIRCMPILCVPWVDLSGYDSGSHRILADNSPRALVVHKNKDSDTDPMRAALERSLGHSFTHGNSVERLRNGVEIFPAMLAAIAGARERISFVTFVYWTGDIAEKFVEALAERAGEGLQVRVLLDAFGSSRMPARLLDALRNASVDVQIFRPTKLRHFWHLNHRTHRKILACDGILGFTGGVGIAEEWEGDARDPSEWRETHFCLRGPCVGELEAAFLENWSEATGWGGVPTQPPESAEARPGDTAVQVVRSSGGPGWSDIRTATHTLIHQAESSIVIATGYFVPDDGLRDALLAAIARGVDIEVMLPGAHTDEQHCNLAGAKEMATLASAGARIWMYEKTMLHHKLLLVDGMTSMFGSPNFNQRSFEQDDEIAAIAINAELNEQLRADFDADRNFAVAFDPQRWKGRSIWTRCKVWAARQVRGHL